MIQSHIHTVLLFFLSSCAFPLTSVIYWANNIFYHKPNQHRHHFAFYIPIQILLILFKLFLQHMRFQVLICLWVHLVPHKVAKIWTHKHNNSHLHKATSMTEWWYLRKLSEAIKGKMSSIAQNHHDSLALPLPFDLNLFQVESSRDGRIMSSYLVWNSPSRTYTETHTQRKEPRPWL